MAGYCKLGLTCGFPEHARGDRVIELKQLYTAPGMTGMGIGASLMVWALAEARARGHDEMQLSVWSGNEGAQRFYARYGFAKVADVTFRVGEQVDHEFLFSRML
jgi:ribosomal protein S18 acetylase RimI-like enzyme